MRVHPKVTAATVGALLVALAVVLGLNLTAEEATSLGAGLAFLFGYMKRGPDSPPATGATGATVTQRRIP